MNHSRLAVVGASLLLLAACSSDKTATAPTSAPATQPPASAPETVAATSPGTAPETVADTVTGDTVAPAPVRIEGKWGMIASTTEDLGYLQPLDAPPYPLTQFQLWDISCSNESCSEATAVVTYTTGESYPDFPIPLNIDLRDGITIYDEYTSGCLDPLTGGESTNGDSTVTASYSLDPVRVGGEVVAYTGTVEGSRYAEASADCVAENARYTADVVLLSEKLQPSDTPIEGVYTGEGETLGVERAVICDDAGACVYRKQLPYSDPALNLVIYRDVPLTRTSTGWGGTVDYLSGCASDITGEFVDDEAYNDVLTVELNTYEVPGWDAPLLVVREDVVGVPMPSKPDDVLAQCAAFERQVAFGGALLTNGYFLDVDAAADTPIG